MAFADPAAQKAYQDSYWQRNPEKASAKARRYNAALGYAKDDPRRLRMLADYLEAQ